MIDQEAWSRFPLRRLAATQLLVAGLAALLGGLGGTQAAWSAAAGAVICGLANTYAAWRVFAARRPMVSAHGELANIYRAEFGKLVMIGALSAALFKVSSVHILAYVGGCAAALLVGTLVAALFNPGGTGVRKNESEHSHGK